MARKKITYPKLVSLVQANELTSEQFKLYFMQAVNIDRGKQPDIVVTCDPTVFWYGTDYLNHPDHRAAGDPQSRGPTADGPVRGGLHIAHR